MEQPQTRKGGRRVLYVVGVAVVAMLLLSVLAAFFYLQAQDYRDAKYKAQYVLVQDILGTIPMASENATDAVDDSLDNGWRRSATMTLSALASGMSGTCHAIQVMYPEDDAKNIAFASLTAAFAALSQGAYEAYVELSSEVGPEEEHDLSAEMDEDLRLVPDWLESLDIWLEQGIDASRDWTQDPYDLLDGMEVEAIYYHGQLLVGTFS